MKQGSNSGRFCSGQLKVVLEGFVEIVEAVKHLPGWNASMEAQEAKFESGATGGKFILPSGISNAWDGNHFID